MAVNPEHLLTLVRVARSGSLSAAAAEANLTQPAVSSQLRLLAQALGEPLFTRHRTGVRLTPAGEGLLPHAHALSRALEGARRYAADLKALGTGSLRVAASSTVASHILPGVLAVFHARFPGVSFEVGTGNTHEVLGLLEGQRAELALIEGSPGALGGDLRPRVFGHDRLRLVLAPFHPLAGRARLAPADLEGLGVVWREPGSGTREVAWQALSAAGVRVREVLTLAGTEGVKEAVLSGLGAALLSELSVRRELDAGLLVSPDLALPGLERVLSVVGPPAELLSAAARTFLELLEETGAETVGGVTAPAQPR